MINRGISYGGGRPDVVQAAERADANGLHLTQFNSGSSRNESNGFRMFLGTAERDHFDGSHLTHLADLRHVTAFLDGFEQAKSQARTEEGTGR